MSIKYDIRLECQVRISQASQGSIHILLMWLKRTFTIIFVCKNEYTTEKPQVFKVQNTGNGKHQIDMKIVVVCQRRGYITDYRASPLKKV